MISRYLPAALVGAATVTVDLVLLFGRVRSTPLLLMAAGGPPLAALLLGKAASGESGSPGTAGKMLGGVLVGATAVPVLVILTHGLFALVAWAFVEPLADAGTALLDGLEVDPSLLEALGNPWALWFLVELAVIAPLSEEFFKPLGALWLRASSRREAFLLGASVGAGFAVIENILYASGWWWSFESWLPIAVLRSTGAGLHLLGAGLVSLAIYERRTGSGRSSVLKMFALAGGMHALWNGSIAVVVVLFAERHYVAGGLAGSSLSWGVALSVFLGALGMLMLAGMVVAGRWSSAATTERSLLSGVSFENPVVVAGWAALACVMLVPLAVMILVFPDFVAL